MKCKVSMLNSSLSWKFIFYFVNISLHSNFDFKSEYLRNFWQLFYCAINQDYLVAAHLHIAEAVSWECQSIVKVAAFSNFFHAYFFFHLSPPLPVTLKMWWLSDTDLYLYECWSCWWTYVKESFESCLHYYNRVFCLNKIVSVRYWSIRNM